MSHGITRVSTRSCRGGGYRLCRRRWAVGDQGKNENSPDDERRKKGCRTHMRQFLFATAFRDRISSCEWRLGSRLAVSQKRPFLQHRRLACKERGLTTAEIANALDVSPRDRLPLPFDRLTPALLHIFTPIWALPQLGAKSFQNGAMFVVGFLGDP